MRGLLLSTSLALASLLGGAELTIPSVVERDQSLIGVYRTGLQATGKGELRIHWTDSYGRVIEDRALAVQLTDEREIRFPLDLTRAVAMQNEVHVHFSFEGVNKKGEKDHREEDVSAKFVARPPDRTWWDYQVIMWQDRSAEQFKRLDQSGVNAGKSAEHSMAIPDSLLTNNMRWYVENMATDFYSAYHIYRPDRPYNEALMKAKAEYKKDPAGKEALKRNPSFEDPEWIAKIHDRLVRYAQVYAPYRPIFYNLADEAGIAELAGFWDFDFSDHSLAAMRRWLATRYGTLAALNQQWEATFSSWEQVTPDTTREAMLRSNENYSSWSDFKEWMDMSFAEALRRGVDAVRSVDPSAYVGIEGAQMPGWGGYDYYRLSNVLQAMEPYDIGENIEIIRSLKPGLAVVTTAFAVGPWEKHRLWYELLHGARGHIIWDEKNDIVKPDGALGSRGEDVGENWRELRGGTGALFINSVRQVSPIAIHYSQASMRTEWMLKQRAKGDAWQDRMSWHERKDSEFLALRNSYCRLIEDEGLQYNFVAYGQVEQGELLKGGYRVLILPHSTSLSRAEADAISDFVRQGGTLVVDGEAGSFDEHSRRLAQSSLAEVIGGKRGKGSVVQLSAIKYAQQRLSGGGAELSAAMRTILAGAAVRPTFAVVDAEGTPVAGVETHEFRNGGVTLIGLLSNPQMQIDDLGEPDAAEGLAWRKQFEKPHNVRLKLPSAMYAFDIRHAKSLGPVHDLALTVEAYEPWLIALSPSPLPSLRVSAPERAARGQTARIGISFDGSTPASTHVLNVAVRNSAGKLIDYYSGNVLAPAGRAGHPIPLAQNEVPGRWTVLVKDLLSGQEQSVAIDVF